MGARRFDSYRENMRVLITSPYGKENLVKAFEKAGAVVVKELFDNPNVIIPTVDEELPFFAANKKWFWTRDIEVVIASSFTIDTCRDKAEFFRFCRRHGFKTPPTLQEDVIVKPRFGKGSKGIVRVDRSFIIQTFITYPEVSIDYFSDLDGNVLSIIPRYRLGIVNGESTEMKTVENFNFNEVKRLGRELMLVGHNVIQGYWTGEEMIFGEVNPRFGGGSHLTFNLFNSPKWLTDKMCISMRKSSITQLPS